MCKLSAGRIAQQFSVRLSEPRLYRDSQCVIYSGFISLVSINKGSCSLTIAKSFGSKVLCRAFFTIDFTSFLGIIDSRLFLHLAHQKLLLCQGFPALLNLLSSICGILTSGTLLSVSIFPSKFGSVWIRCEVKHSGLMPII